MFKIKYIVPVLMGALALFACNKDDEQTTTARSVVAKELNVRETEALIKKIQEPVKVKEEKTKDPDTKSLEQNLSEKLKIACR